MRGSLRKRRPGKRLTKKGRVRQALIILLMILTVVIVALLIARFPV